jgi:hypothetical protein
MHGCCLYVTHAKVASSTINTCIANVVPYLFDASDTQQQHLSPAVVAVVADAAATAPTTAVA